jgi:hypothetical protein
MQICAVVGLFQAVNQRAALQGDFPACWRTCGLPYSGEPAWVASA